MSSALRSLGSVYRCDIPLPDAQRASTVRLLCESLTHPAAKVQYSPRGSDPLRAPSDTTPALQVRWNACIASLALLTATPVDEVESASAPPVTRALIDCLAQDSSFKVRIHAANALASAPTATRPHRDELFRICDTALQELGTQLSAYGLANRERAHAEVLVKRVGPVSSRAGDTAR